MNLFELMYLLGVPFITAYVCLFGAAGAFRHSIALGVAGAIVTGFIVAVYSYAYRRVRRREPEFSFVSMTLLLVSCSATVALIFRAYHANA